MFNWAADQPFEHSCSLMDITPPVVAITTGQRRQLSDKEVFPTNPPILKRSGGLEATISPIPTHPPVFKRKESRVLMCQLNLCYTINTHKKINQEEGMQLLDDPFLQKWRLCRPEENYGQYPLIIQKLLKSPCNNTDEHEPCCTCTLLPTRHKITTSTSSGRLIQ